MTRCLFASLLPFGRGTQWLFLVLLVGSAPLPANAREKARELTGCVDEQPGPRYVLRGDRQLRLIAVLEPDGFSVQNFAGYLGHKVVVTGQLATTGEPPVMRVRKLKRIARRCLPEAPEGAPASSQGPPAAPPRLSRVMTMTGCVDEQPGPRYVLRGDRELKLLAELEPEGFPLEGFARYLGQKVRIRGRTFTLGDRTFMRVDEVERVAGRCAPAPPAENRE